MSLRLFSLPRDCLSSIALLLDAPDLQKLIYCGNSTLVLHLRQIWTDFVFRIKQFGKFPFSAFNLPHLRNISVTMADHISIYPLNLHNQHLSLPQPLKSLRNLTFEFLQSMRLLGNTMPFNHWFPNLVSLKIKGELLEQDVYQSGWPHTLVSLYLEHTSVHRALIDFNLFSTWLPRYLEKLVLIGVTIQAETSSKDKIDFPPYLLSLVLDNLEYPQVLNDLPSTVTSLCLKMAGTIKTSNLPSGLLYLSVYGDSLTWDIDSLLPRSLLAFNVPKFDVKAVEDIPNFFPSSLTDCSFFSAPWASLKLMPQFPNLKRFIAPPRCYPSELALISLPPYLQVLHLHAQYPVPLSEAGFPQTLTDLRTPISSLREFRLIPSKVKILHFLGSASFRIASEEWKRLIPHLKQLKLPEVALESVSVLKEMQNLEKLEILVHQPRQLSDLINEPIFPSSLTDLSVQGKILDPEVDWTPMLMNLGNLTKLEILSITYQQYGGPPRSDALHKCFPRLPASLKKLNIPVLENLPYSAFGDLPRSLVSLVLSSMAKDSFINNRHFHNLPPSLTRLDVDCCDVDQELWNIIPDGIGSVSGRQIGHSSILRVQYYLRPIWDGCLLPE